MLVAMVGQSAALSAVLLVVQSGHWVATWAVLTVAQMVALSVARMVARLAVQKA